MAKAFQELKDALSLQKEVTALLKNSPTQLNKDDRFKQLEMVEKSLNKQFETTTAFVRLGKKVGQLLPSISGELYTFDFDVIGTGGIPKGRIIEFYGPESSGKTTLATHYIAKCQQAGGIGAYIDAEHALDPSYMAKLGVDVDNLIVAQPDSGEQALETAVALVDSKAVDLIVIDSVAALVPQAELDGEMGDAHVGLHARMMSQAMRKLRGRCATNQIPIIFINQIREKIGVMFGNPETTTGGRALKFYASLRVEIRKVSKSDGGEIVSGGVLVGHKMRLKAVKNKVGPPLRDTIVECTYGVGIDTVADFITYASKVGAIEKNGSWFTFKGENIGQGLDKTIANIRDDQKLMAALKEEVAKAQKAQREAE